MSDLIRFDSEAVHRYALERLFKLGGSVDDIPKFGRVLFSKASQAGRRSTTRHDVATLTREIRQFLKEMKQRAQHVSPTDDGFWRAVKHE